MSEPKASPLKTGEFAIHLEGKRIGTIKRHGGGWAYNPIRTKLIGKVFAVPFECFYSLLSEEAQAERAAQKLS